ncbi:MAG: SgcJ/EcaC family oxidoreductase [Xenococcus sp. MO_188.B8]|nr:SgcJ/EcaC family oxidoreductase [Xenococcus sp. MO_188.B8]
MSSSDREEIRKLFEEVYAENVRTKNLQGYGDMYTDSALWMAPNVPDRCGREDILEGFAQSIANQDIDPIFTADEIKVMGDFGYVIGISIATIYPYDGSPSKRVKFRALWLMKKEPQQWKIDRQIWNNKPLSKL